MTLDDIIAKAQLDFQAQQIPTRPDGLSGDGWHKTAKHYICTIRRQGFGARTPVGVCYSMGSGHKTGPRLRDVLDCLASEADVLNYDSFEAWAADIGYDPDSRKAETIYSICRAQTKALRALLDKEFFDALLAAERL